MITRTQLLKLLPEPLRPRINLLTKFGNQRSKFVAKERAKIVTYLRDFHKLSYPEIAVLLKMHHSSIMFLYNRFPELRNGG